MCINVLMYVFFRSECQERFFISKPLKHRQESDAGQTQNEFFLTETALEEKLNAENAQLMS